MRSRIIATGSYVPDKVVTNDDLAKIMDTSHEWIVQRTGIAERRFEEKSNRNMAYNASLSALSGLDVQSIDLIIVCSYTPDKFIPTGASLLKRDLGIKADIACFDLNAACSGFVYGLQMADALLLSKKYHRILLVGSEFTSRTLDFSDRSTSILFGDGAGAVVLELGEMGIVDTILGGQDDLEDSITLPNDKDSFFQMKGSEVFRFAIKAFSKSVKDLLKRNNITVDSIDFVVSHQANARIIESCAKTLKMDLAKFPMNLDVYGNTSAASIPLVLDELNRSGKLVSGMKIVVVAFGGGLTYGASLIEW